VKKLIVLVALLAFVTGLMFVCSNMALAAEKNKPKAAPKTAPAPAPTAPKATPAPAAPITTPAPKVVCKFKDKDQMAEFEQLYIAKQATFGRMSVLQAYFSLETNNLQAIDKQMEEKFKLKMDPKKMYDLNRDAMEIREVGDIPTDAQGQPVPPPARQ
jgi:hypothetical protein